MRSIAKDRAVPRPRPRKPAGSGGQRGGWNAGPYIGTARVQVHGCIRDIAIRARKDGRLYGYAGRTQVCWSGRHFSNFPSVMSGVKVISYSHGGTL